MRVKPNPITAVVPQPWSPSPRESHVFQPQYRGNTANTATVHVTLSTVPVPAFIKRSSFLDATG